jgi:hypothetical protein
MVYAEIVLEKVVDWSTIKNNPKLTVPTERDIPQERKFADGGLGKSSTKKEEDLPGPNYESEESEEDSNSDGTCGEKMPRRNRSRANPTTVATNELPRNRAAAANDGQVDAVGNNNENEVVLHVVVDSENQETIVGDVPEVSRVDGTNEMEQLRSQLVEKDRLIAQLENTIRSLRLETASKDTVISEMRNQLQQRPEMEVAPSSPPTVVVGAMEVDDDYINKVVDIATSGVLEDICTPAPRQRAPVVLLPVGPEARSYVDIDGPLSEDSLSFPTNAQTAEVDALKNANDELRLRLSVLSQQYYQWKVATILNVDRGRQMANEFKKIDNEYLQNNVRRDFGLTSWAHTDELYPPDLPMQPNSELIDWAKLDFDHANAMSCHDLQMNPEVQSKKLWPLPASFVVEGEECGVCCNAFGPEGAWALGTCQHKFHPMCLITGGLTRRFCSVYRSPFDKRLYDVFGLTAYMPPSHERNPENTPGVAYRGQWGEDLIWSWRANTHSVFKNNVSADFGWEYNHEDIVRVCHKIVGSAVHDEGKRNFFYQTLDGFWDSEKKRFQFGQHPEGKLWDREGNLVTDLRGWACLSTRNAVHMDLSEWKEIWKQEAVAYLLDSHTPETLRTLEELRNSQMVRVLGETDGPFRRTRTRVRRNILSSDGAGPSGTADVVDLDET